MKKRILLTIAYDGTNYFGWQKQKKESIPTVERYVEKACRQLFQADSLECIGASRTDKGVHALGQRAIIDVETTIPTLKIPLAIRPFLPEDIVIHQAQEVPETFHPRFDCIQKTYEYKILNSNFRNPLLRNYSEWICKPLDILKMEKGADAFVGTHDFKAFCAAGSMVRSTVRTIFHCHVRKEENFVIIEVTGDGFLYNMVRILSGTLIEVGLGKIPPEQVTKIIQSKERKNAGKTVGPQGLTLIKIDYNH